MLIFLHPNSLLLKMRILVIEDDEQVGEAIQKSLKEQYYSVDIATDGEEGVFLA